MSEYQKIIWLGKLAAGLAVAGSQNHSQPPLEMCLAICPRWPYSYI